MSVAALLLAVPAAATAQAPPAPRATVRGAATTFLPPLGLWDADAHTARLLFVTTPLAPEAEAAARRDGAWPEDGIGPAITLDLTFAEGRYSAALPDLASCALAFHAFRNPPADVVGEGNACHLVSTGGRLQPAGMLIGLAEGTGTGYDVRLPFSVMFPPAATTTAAPATAAPVEVAPPVPLGAVTGTGTFMGQTLTFTHGLAWFTAERLEVALFTHPPAAGMLAELRTGSWGEGGPAATLSFEFDRATPGPAAVTYCFVNLTFPKGGPMSLNVNQASGCGLTTFTGVLTAGGAVAAQLTGSAAMRDRQPMAWRLAFHLPIAK